jgi:flagellar basal-body rod protein FlgG
MGIVELGGVIIAQATRRVELAAQNMANMTTAGYKARGQFQSLINSDELGHAGSHRGSLPGDLSVDFTAGKLQHTGNPFDLAISGAGFFVVRTDAGLLYTRAGQFSRDSEGRLVSPDGGILQSTSGDMRVESGNVSVLADGTFLQTGQPVGQLAIAGFDDPRILRPTGAGLFSAPSGAGRDVTSPQIHQGMLEASNVTTASEMISMMAGLRSAEAGQRVVQVYDDLMGRALTSFGQM